ncbi:ssDNA-binding protein [Ochrobactrum sp. GPK 3]
MAEARASDPARVKLRNVRLSYPSLWKAKSFGDGSEGEPKFSAVALMDPETKHGKRNIALIEDAIEYVKEKQWPKGAPKLAAGKLCLRDGNDLEEAKDGYDDMMYVSASDSKRPRVLDIDGEDVRDGDEGAPYAGCFVDMIIRVWAQDNKFGKRVNASLIAVKFRDDGDAFGAAPFDPNEFDEDDDDAPARGRGKSRSRDDDDEKASRSRRSRDDDDDEKPSRSRRSRDDDEDDEKPARRRSKDDDEEEAPRRRRSRDDDDEEEKPRRRRSRDDDDEEEKPRRRRSRDDDDEEEKPRRRRSRDDDDLA